MKRKYLATLGLLAIGFGAVGVALFAGAPSGGTAVTYRTSTATTTTVSEQAVANGTLVAATTYALSFGSAPRATSASTSTATATSASGAATATWPVSAVNVALGDIVRTGDVLASADDTNAQLQLTIARANLAAAKSKLKTDKAGADATTRAAARDSVTQASLQVSQARQSYADTVRQSSLSVTRARTAVTTATAQLARDRTAHAPSQTISADRAAVTQAKQNLAQAQAQAASSNHQAANQVANAAHSLTSAKHNYTKQVAPASSAQVATDEAAVATAQSALASAQATAAYATITAPIDGRITAVNLAAGSDAPSGTAIELQSTRLAVTASFSEDDILRLQVGQAASVAISATDTTAAGTVWKISPTASGTSGSSVVTYKVTILLDETTGVAPVGTVTGGAAVTAAATASPSPSAGAATTADPLPGMSAEADITIAEVKDVVAIPAIALAGTSGNYTVRVLDASGQVASRGVEVGLVTTTLAEIRSGLAAGDAVVTGTSADQTTTASGTSSSSRGSNGNFGPPGDFGGGLPVGPVPGGQ